MTKKTTQLLVAALFGSSLPIAAADVERSGRETVQETRAERVQRVQQGVLADYEAGRQHCLTLEGKQREACDARAAATARAPQGRLGRVQAGSEPIENIENIELRTIDSIDGDG